MILAERVLTDVSDVATDVAAEMSIMQPQLQDCAACSKACQAALQMLRVCDVSLEIARQVH